MKLLCLCDTPTMETGFARVARNLLSRWHKAGSFEQMWVWGVGYTGFPHSIDYLANRICPASTYNDHAWYSELNLRRFLTFLQRQNVGGTPGGFTHLWILQDTFLLYPMASALRDICTKLKIRSALYFPVDAAMEPEWCDIIDLVDQPVAYCYYGRDEAEKALCIEGQHKKVNKHRKASAERIKVIPHGVDTSLYKPLEPKVRAEVREKTFKDKAGPNDFLIVNVNQHQKRKGLAQTLGVLAALKRSFQELRPKLYLHMARENEGEATDLPIMAAQFGLVNGKDVFYGDQALFTNNHATLEERYMNNIYAAADLLLTTSYGEGWGLSITEAMAAGVPVAGPRHTSIGEILGNGRGVLFNTSGPDVLPGDNSRLRPRSDVDDAAMQIANACLADDQSDGTAHGSLSQYAERGHKWATSDYLNWDKIAAQWLDVIIAP